MSLLDFFKGAVGMSGGGGGDEMDPNDPNNPKNKKTPPNYHDYQGTPEDTQVIPRLTQSAPPNYHDYQGTPGDPQVIPRLNQPSQPSQPNQAAGDDIGIIPPTPKPHQQAMPQARPQQPPSAPTVSMAPINTPAPPLLAQGSPQEIFGQPGQNMSSMGILPMSAPTPKDPEVTRDMQTQGVLAGSPDRGAMAGIGIPAGHMNINQMDSGTLADQQTPQVKGGVWSRLGHGLKDAALGFVTHGIAGVAPGFVGGVTNIIPDAQRKQLVLKRQADIEQQRTDQLHQGAADLARDNYDLNVGKLHERSEFDQDRIKNQGDLITLQGQKLTDYEQRTKNQEATIEQNRQAQERHQQSIAAAGHVKNLMEQMKTLDPSIPNYQDVRSHLIQKIQEAGQYIDPEYQPFLPNMYEKNVDASGNVTSVPKSGGKGRQILNPDGSNTTNKVGSGKAGGSGKMGRKFVKGDILQSGIGGRNHVIVTHPDGSFSHVEDEQGNVISDKPDNTGPATILPQSRRQ